MNVVVRLALVSLSFVLTVDLPEQRFDSENKSTQLHPPALKAKPRVKYPVLGRKADYKEREVLDSANLQAIAGKLKHDVLVGGKVLSPYVPKSGSPLILNFGDPKKCFKVVIFEDDFAKWGAATPAEIAKLYVGKLVVVGGYVADFKGDLQIAVSVPSQIVVITQ